MISSIDVEGIGRLSHKGVSKFWTGEVSLAGEVRPIPLSIGGTAQGPTVRQIDAVRAMLAASANLKGDAEQGLARLLTQAGMDEQDPWSAFEVSDIHVPDESYDPAAIHVLVCLQHVEHADEFCPAIDVVEGVTVDVLSGT